jgi:hypothetical protein
MGVRSEPVNENQRQKTYVRDEQVDQPTEPETWTETMEVAGNQVIGLIKQLLRSGQVLRIVVRSEDDEVLADLSIPEGAVLYGIIALFYPFLIPLGVIVVAMKKVKLEIVRPGPYIDKEEL